MALEEKKDEYDPNRSSRLKIHFYVLSEGDEKK